MIKEMLDDLALLQIVFIAHVRNERWAYKEGNHITKTCLYNVDPLKPQFYIVKLGFTGVYIIFLILLEYIDCQYSLEPPCQGGSNKYPQSMFWAEIWKISGFLSDFFFFSFLRWNLLYIWIGVLRNELQKVKLLLT